MLRGYETGTFWDWRALAGTRDVARHGEACWGTRHRLTGRSENPCKQAIGVAQAGSTRTPSFAREGVGERATHAEGELLGAEWSTPCHGRPRLTQLGRQPNGNGFDTTG